ncbi:DUF6335 family protein [Spirulina sp. CS-785/01]|uniref:DUF6335 family protein n=1 Tax=Spirulina sp. CS-785/01 TaxID=3021716 RepID=UPI00232A9CF8|nr:DUF6335 family protein [Spirulina sp. CS-785/01]MDB9311480.1 DUF6335 family protein [Spirulina sp. CS-785/01]
MALDQNDLQRATPNPEDEITPTTGGDIETDNYQAKVVGEESVGGTTPTPEQDAVDHVAASTGVELDDNEPVTIHDKIQERDQQRLELE